MFGFSFGEIVFVAIIALIAVGPDKMPELMKTLGRAMREFQKAGRELRAQSGIDEIMESDEIAELKRLRDLKLAAFDAASAKLPAPLSAEDRAREFPAAGVDVDLAVSRAPLNGPPA